MSEVLPQALVEESKFRLRIYLEVQLVHPSSFKFHKFIRLGLVVFMWARTGVCCPECMITELPGSSMVFLLTLPLSRTNLILCMAQLVLSLARRTRAPTS